MECFLENSLSAYNLKATVREKQAMSIIMLSYFSNQAMPPCHSPLEPSQSLPSHFLECHHSCLSPGRPASSSVQSDQSPCPSWDSTCFSTMQVSTVKTCPETFSSPDVVMYTVLSCFFEPLPNAAEVGCVIYTPCSIAVKFLLFPSTITSFKECGWVAIQALPSRSMARSSYARTSNPGL